MMKLKFNQMGHFNLNSMGKESECISRGFHSNGKGIKTFPSIEINEAEAQ